MIVACAACSLRYDVTGRPPGTVARCRCGHAFTLPEPPVDARALRCPVCGAHTNPARHRCEHCDAALATRRCPACFSLQPADARFCSGCGAALDGPAQPLPTDVSPRRCPRCRESMIAVLADDVLIDQCERCGGVWIDRPQLQRIVEHAERAAGAEAALGHLSPPRQPIDTSAVVYLPCPDCDKPMMRRNFARISGIVVDDCNGHGTWLDHGELARVVRFVRDGGLVRARQREVDELERRLRERRVAERAQPVLGPDPEESAWRSPVVEALASFLSRLFEA
ncbi:MAG: zf-TFIIB domain-containing protein [Myxococcales bacterium]|nr:zf-TFIIB domain-containing protein [Myxococcales bacterium]